MPGNVRRLACLSLAVAALVVTPDRSARAGPVPLYRGQADIVVRGGLPTREEALRRAYAFVRKSGVVSADDSVARWTTAICPRAAGLPEDHGALVERWFREIAKAAGARLGEARCEPNLIIDFVPDGSAFLRAIDDRKPSLLGTLAPGDIRRLVGGDEPVRWWHVVGRHAGGGTGSLILPMTVRTIEAATIVVDVRKAQGIGLRAITAYAAFVGLAAVRNGVGPEYGSILDLFDDPGNTRDLSARDRRFLRELYRMPLERKGIYQRGRLIRAILGEGIAAEGGAKAVDGR